MENQAGAATATASSPRSARLACSASLALFAPFHGLIGDRAQERDRDDDDDGERRESGRRSLACHAMFVAILLIASFLADGSLDIAGSQAEQAFQPERNVRLRVSTIRLESL
jgi:hypothetical protein